MANRNFKPGAMCIEKGTIKLYGQALVTDGAGAITDDSKGFSMTRVGVGEYDILLEDAYTDLRNVTGVVSESLGGATGYILTISKGDIPNKSLTITWLDATGVASEVPSGAVFYVEITLKNSTVDY